MPPPAAWAKPTLPTLCLCLIGIAVGCLVTLVSGRLARWLGPSRFWQSLPGILRILSAGADSDQFGAAYAALLRGLAGYLGRNAVVWGAALIPVGLLAWWGAPQVHRHLARQATGLAIASSVSTDWQIGGQAPPASAAEWSRMTSLEPTRGEIAPSNLRVRVGESWVEFPDWRLPNALTSSPWAGLGLELLGFTVRPFPVAGPETCLIRPDGAGVRSWCWPWLSAPELAFYAGLTGGSLLLLARRSPHRTASRPDVDARPTADFPSPPSGRTEVEGPPQPVSLLRLHREEPESSAAASPPPGANLARSPGSLSSAGLRGDATLRGVPPTRRSA